MRAARVRHAPLLAALAAVAVSTAARADGWSLLLNPTWNASTTRLEDETGRGTTIESRTLSQRYRLSLDETLWPLLTVGAGANLDWVTGTQRAGGPASEIDAKVWNVFATLRAGGPFLRFAGDFGLREQMAETVAAGVSTSAPVFARRTYGGTLSWHPSELPSADLQLSHADTYDRERELADVSSESAALTLRYEPVEKLNLHYALLLGRGIDRLRDFETREVTNALSASWDGSFLGGRVGTYLNYSASLRESTVVARGAGGTVLTQQLTAGGLSKVEVFPDVPARVTLNPNAALVDGSVGASAGLNLGYSATARGDVAYRDMGAVFPDVVTPVNVVYLYVDRSLPASLAGAFSWTAWRSDDNLDWTPVAIAGPVVFDPLQNRFEIPIERTEARHLKVVTRPLGFGLTTDPLFAEIFVTEIQFYLGVPVQEAVGWSSIFSENLNGSARVLLVREWNLSYDFAGSLIHTTDPDRVTWSVTNGLSIANPISRRLSYAARLDRSDSDAGRGHVAQTRWSGALSATPLPTLGGSVTYSGQVLEAEGGTAMSNGVTAVAHADLYEGFSVNASAGYSLAESDAGRTSRGANGSVSVALVPNRKLTMNGTLTYAYGEQSGGGLPSSRSRSGLVDGNFSYSPFPALAVAGGVTRIFEGTLPSTLANAAISISPFQGGDLQVQYGYQETIDTGSETRVRTHGPSARWNIRRGWNLTSGAQFVTSTAPAQRVETWALNVSLLATFQ